ncbi:isoleucine--tRNA ligase [Trichuris suis]|nr:isoleucine--tRNA ligase [Trichuris suis]
MRLYCNLWTMASRVRCVFQSRIMKSTYSNTVLLPKSTFPVHMKADERIDEDRKLAVAHDVQSIYEKQLYVDPDKPLFVLLDGPPYANGDVHIGHAVNKILKDIVVRYKIMTGHRVHFRPGWDCHGLPVELKATKSLSCGNNTDPIAIRTAARKFAEKAIESQMSCFKEWAILGDWSNRYATFDSRYKSTELRFFKALYESGLTFRAFKPVYWSPTAKTALAEAELEYCPTHRSLAVYFTMLTINFPKELFALSPLTPVWAVVWTTTPWTLPVNDAICYNSNLQYCLVTLERGRKRKTKKQLDYYLIGLDSLERFQAALQRPVYVASTFPGTLLQGLLYSMPLLPDQAFPFYPGAHVDSKQGTCLVHTAFAHGFDDFNVGIEHGREIQSLVDEQGRYVREMGPPLWGKDVMTEGPAIFLATYPKHVLAREEIVHSYPYDWRTGKPVIIRSSKQWFVDTDQLKQCALDSLRKVNVFPPSHVNSMVEMISRRPLWCISRQRVWGTPIPVLYCVDTDEPLAVSEVIDHVMHEMECRGWDAWWTHDATEFLPRKYKSIPVKKSDEVFDVWFDSGLSWAAILDQDSPQADLVVEGLDQVRGWFQSLLFTSVANRKKAPYKHIIVHGFVQDEQGRKMSKSAGNVVAPDVFLRGGTVNNKTVPPLGVDGLRLWVALYGSDRTNIPVGESSIVTVRSTLVQIRSVLRFLSGVLHDFDPSTDHCSYDQLSTVDKYMLRRLSEYIASLRDDLERYRIVSAMTKAVHFINGDVSNFYCTTVKNRLYCCPKTSVTRRSAQTVLHNVVSTCVRSIAPILPNLAEEYLRHVAGAFGGSVLESGWPEVPDTSYHGKEEESDFKVALSARAKFLASYGSQHTMQYHLAISSSATVIRSLMNIVPASELVDLFLVSTVELKENMQTDDDNIVFSVSPSAYQLCPRCKRYTRNDSEDLCLPCTEACHG